MDVKQECDIFLYTIKYYQRATERYNSTSQALTNAKVSEAKQANLHRTTEPQYNVRDNVLLAIENIHIKDVLQKM